MLVLDRLPSRPSLGQMISRLQTRLTMPMSVEGNDLTPSASIGIARYPDDGTDIESLVHAADAAMYQAKKQGGNRFEFHTPL